ncbi:Ada metal-binding domain-containing protein [Pedobacter punctiformis]|uniref:Metal-binding protein n=1 Tax=Pedobacter punctiformis TaxID=3004097 RepID=A0ABT4L980_9SPHI|nr:Ada metal-binding domain-containing protein [Pedobacter sp. HCMS5-2]MCZ4244476.1 metal-binding protein [Pedobacter sp. HCMS5-2]
MILHSNISSLKLKKAKKQKEICYGGNLKLKIYGTLHCKSGKRMKMANRIFFSSETEAIQNGYRPCGHCMHAKYQNWKNGFIQ